MSTHAVHHPQAAHMALPGIRQVSFQQTLQWLRAGAQDMAKAWPLSLLYGIVFALLGLWFGAWCVDPAASGAGTHVRLPVCCTAAGYGVLLPEPPTGAPPQTARTVGAFVVVARQSRFARLIHPDCWCSRSRCGNAYRPFWLTVSQQFGNGSLADLLSLDALRQHTDFMLAILPLAAYWH